MPKITIYTDGSCKNNPGNGKSFNRRLKTIMYTTKVEETWFEKTAKKIKLWFR